MTDPNPDPNPGPTPDPEPGPAGARPAFDMDSYMKPGRLPGWIAPAALLLGVIGTVLSLWAVKSASDNAPGVTLTGDSKERVCSAFNSVAKAVKLQTNGGPEPLPEPLAATNARQALLDGGEYLLGQIDAKTPKDLADAAVAFANDIRMLGINYLGGAVSTDQVQKDLIARADTGLNSVADLCK